MAHRSSPPKQPAAPVEHRTTDMSPRSKARLLQFATSQPLSLLAQCASIPTASPQVNVAESTLHDAVAQQVTAQVAGPRYKFDDVDDRYFNAARGVTSTAAVAIRSMSASAKDTALLELYVLLHQCIGSCSENLPDSTAPDAPSPAHDSLSQQFAAHSSTDFNGSRTPSMSIGNASLVSLSRMPAVTNNSAKRGIDDESGNKKINEYVILGDIGRGSQGKVKLAFDTERNQLRAIKIIRRPPALQGHRVGGKVSAEEQRRRLEHEIAITKRLRHKNLVSLFEVIDDEEQDKLYLVFQHVSCGEIATMKGSFCRRYDEARCAGFARQLTAGIAYLHEHGVVHRDIKPENILLEESDELFIVDFGVAEMLQQSDEGSRDSEDVSAAWSKRRQTSQNQQLLVSGSVGTPAFMAPELLDVSASTADVACGDLQDVWSLGVTLFALLCGRLPWVCEDRSVDKSDPARYAFNMREYFNAVCQAPPMYPPQQWLTDQNDVLAKHFDFQEKSEPLSKQWVELLDAMLQKDPMKRPPIHTVRRRVKGLRVQNIGVGFRKPSDEKVQTGTERKVPVTSDVAPLPSAGQVQGSSEPEDHGNTAPPKPEISGVVTEASIESAGEISDNSFRPRRRTRQWIEE